MARYDIIYTGNSIEIEPHFCRIWDENGGCYGTNEEHGMSWDEAKRHVIEYYKGRIAEIENMEEDQ